MKKYILGLKKHICIFTLIYLVNTLSFAVIPLINKSLFDSVVGDAQYSLLQLVLYYVVCVLVHLTTAYGTNIWSWKIGIKFEGDMKRDYFSAMSHMPYTRFKQKDIGEYISIQGNDITTIEADYLTPLISFFNQIIVFAVYGVILFIYVDWRVALALLATSLLLLPLSNITSRKLAAKRKAYSDSQGSYTARITDFLTGKHLISRITMAAFEREHERAREETARARYAYGKSKSIILPFNASFSFVLTIVAFAVTGYLLFQKEITVGVAIAALGYIEAFLSPLQEIVYDVTTIGSTKEVRNKVQAVLAAPEENLEEKNSLNTSLQLNHVRIQFERFQMKDFSFTFERNKKYAIIGHNGSGKSTILRIIAKHIVVDSGDVLFDGKNAAEVDASGLICYISQHEHLFSDTFLNNVSVFSSYRIVQEDAERAIGEDIYDGLHNQEDCQTLSGGEKQVVKFVRMLAEDKPVCILDEPFAEMDIYRTQKIMEQIMRMKGKTFIVVTHNLSEDLKGFDEIILMGDGEILQHGSYADVSKTSDFQTLKATSEVLV